MFDPSRDQARQFFLDAWRKYRNRDVLTQLETLAADLWVLWSWVPLAPRALFPEESVRPCATVRNDGNGAVTLAAASATRGTLYFDSFTP